MKQKAWTIVMEILGLALLGFTASRTIDLFNRILPGESMIVGIFALAALDVGLVGWTNFYLSAARGDAQRGIALLMICVDLAGVAIAFMGDMLIRGGQSGIVAAIDQNTGLAIVVGLGIIITANIAAFIAAKAASPDAQLRRAEEKAHSAIDMARLEQIRSNSERLAAELAPQTAAAWMNNTRDRVLAETGRTYGGQKPMQSMAADGVEAPSPKARK